VTPTCQLLLPEIQDLIRTGQYGDLREALHHLHPADIADLVHELGVKDGAVAFRFLQRDDAAAAFAYIPPEEQEHVIAELGTEQSARLIEEMSADDRARVVDELPEEVAQRLVASLAPESRKEVQAILGYPPRSVGRLMTPDYVKVQPDWTVAKALEHIRKTGKDAETVNVIYVVDEQGKLIDDMRLRQVILSDPGARIDDLMNRSFVTLRADQDQGEAVQLMGRYDRTALPVVDSRGVLIGIVTHDDVADVAQRRATEQMQKVGGVQALEEPFDQASVADLVKKRAPWLALLFMSELLTSNALVYFQDQIERAAILAVFVPAIISSGGNSGSQASTLVIRALALGEVKLHDWWKILRRELVVAGVLGAIIGCLGFARINIWGLLGWWVTKEKDASGAIVTNTHVQEHYTVLGVAIAVSLIGVVIWGSIMGAMLPFILKRCKLDPAGSSTPFVATMVDVTGIIIYFTAAMLILKGTLL
jgi:magnesium transporter